VLRAKRKKDCDKKETLDLRKNYQQLKQKIRLSPPFVAR
jgi:hypothetical protein